MFFAVDPPDMVRAHLEHALAPLRDSPGEPRWTPSTRWHVTLLFLGTVPPERLPLLVTSAAPAVAGTPPMALQLVGGGRFGSSRRPSVLWIGLDGDIGALSALARQLTGTARALGLPVEDRPFRAHLTVGRWRPRQPADASLASRLVDYRGPAWPVTEVRLLQSHLGPDPRYEPLATWPVNPR